MTQKVIEIIIQGKPIAYAPPRITRFGSFNPRHKQKIQIQNIMRIQYKEEPLEGPIFLTLEFYMPIPKGTSKVKRDLMLSNRLQHLKKPDCSNCIKFYEDCLKGVHIRDDSQVTEMIARKFYSLQPRTVIIIHPL